MAFRALPGAVASGNNGADSCLPACLPPARPGTSAQRTKWLELCFLPAAGCQLCWVSPGLGKEQAHPRISGGLKGGRCG